MSSRFRRFEDQIRKLGAFCTWLCCVLLIGLCVSPAAMAQTTVTYIHTDALGSVVAESDVNGNVIRRYDYEPYGAVVGGQVTDGPGYTGHVSDSATGLSYMQQRYMDPQLGVFLSVDPVTAYEQPVGQFNRYRYANGNPYKFLDPDGRQSLPRSVYETDWTKPETRQAFREAASMVADFTPIVGDIKGGVEAVQDPSAVNIAAAVVGLVPVVGDGAGKLIKGADNIADGVRLNKQLASEQQLGELISGQGDIIAGGPGEVLLRDSARLSAVHGGQASDWTKVSSSSHKAPDGQQFSTHAYRNQASGQVVETKTKIIEEGK
ncbi:RHS repeat-associated core domain-containing protein [Stenotrophomonas sp. S39]|uniref:RHS repeat domain-containing protein n=1 Tax=Stenotrophomonas sp. S39 TaxID=2767451 RepID=UPI002D7E3289|nr:RHS repeat-associated core domain-containing protein [Stenotrophomonas sp. S39]